MPFDGGLSPLTDKSIMPANNVPTIQDILNGTPYKIPSAGGDWSSGWGEDDEKSYKEKGDDYKRMEMDWDIIKRMTEPSNGKPEKWKVRMPGGSKFFPSFNSATRFEQFLRDKGIKDVFLSRVASSSDDSDIVADSMPKCFKVEAIDMNRGIKEVGSSFCVAPKYFVTCAHVIKKYDKNSNISGDLSYFSDGVSIKIINNSTWHEANLVAIDPHKDIAVLYSDIDCPSFDIDKSVIKPGENILTIGSPHGYTNHVAFGKVGSINRKIYEYDGSPLFMFVDMSIFSGNSGGPIIRQENGKVMGMIVLVISKNGTYGLNAGIDSKYIESILDGVLH